jgi:hypothetical protein
MTVHLLARQSRNVTSNSTNQPFCGGGDELWGAVQALIAFLVTNILAHAASIYLANGSDVLLSTWSVFHALLLPVNAGDRAFHAIGRWITKLRKGQINILNMFGGFTFEDAATSGAIAIAVPLEFVPLVQGRWDSISPDHQRLVMLDNEEFWHGENWGFRGHPGGLPFKISDKFSRYTPFVLPPTTRFKKYQNYKISPQSSFLSQVIAVFQLFLSGRSLYIKYYSSIRSNGLASPYLVVIPYLFMTLVNLVAITLVGSYTQIVVLPMEETRLPKRNQVYIGGWPNEAAIRVIALVEEQEGNLNPEQDVAISTFSPPPDFAAPNDVVVGNDLPESLSSHSSTSIQRFSAGLPNLGTESPEIGEKSPGILSSRQCAPGRRRYEGSFFLCMTNMLRI